MFWGYLLTNFYNGLNKIAKDMYKGLGNHHPDPGGTNFEQINHMVEVKENAVQEEIHVYTTITVLEHVMGFHQPSGIKTI